MEIKELAALLQEKVNAKMGEFEEIGAAVKLMMVMKYPQEKIDAEMWKLAVIINDLRPVLYIIKFQYPYLSGLVDALTQKWEEKDRADFMDAQKSKQKK